MNIENEIADLRRRIDNLIRTGVVTDVNLKEGTCRVKSGKLETCYLPVSVIRAGDARVWWSPSVGEQVTLFCMSGNPETAIVFPGLFCDAFPQPDAREKTLHIHFPDDAIIEYDANASALLATGMATASIETSESITASTSKATVNATDSINATTKQATVKATSITLDAPTVTCTGLMQAKSISVGGSGGGSATISGPVNIKGSVTQTRGSLSSNGIVLGLHKHDGVQPGGGTTGGPV
ncbi:phage baseplate assembly protein V [Salmonella enterica subsp. enterica serovar Minnesota]|nr:phage baseplate assembly protein V [Salmonella enterica subsp. enterica serovar Minnesota]